MKMLHPRGVAALLVLAVALAAAVIVAAPVASAAPAATSSAVTVPVSGTNATNSFSGQFTLTGFRVVNGALAAVGTLSGTITNLATGATTTVTNAPVTIPVSAVSGTCQILHLELGPLDLSLLGLNVHLNRVVLDITATSGPGNLLGNLLCGLAGLLDSGSSLTGIANVLNQIVALL